MRILFVLMFALAMQASATGYSQKITLKLKNAPIERVFTHLKKQTEYSFMWDEQLLLKTSPVSINVKNASLEKVLEICLEKQPLHYKVIGNVIVLFAKQDAAGVLEEKPIEEAPIPPT